jgi:hypothetical protein
MGTACAFARSFAIDQVSRILALPMDYRRIALRKEGISSWRSDFGAPFVEETRSSSALAAMKKMSGPAHREIDPASVFRNFGFRPVRDAACE